MRVDLGSHVKSRDGQDVGVVKHIIVDPADNRVKAVVVEEGFILTQDSVVPIGDISLTLDNEVQINMLAEEMKNLPAFHASDYVAPHDRLDHDLQRSGTPLVGVLWPGVNPFPGSITGSGGYGAFPLIAPMEDMQESVPRASVDREEMTVPAREPEERRATPPLTAISRGSDVYSMSGEKVGEVKDVEFDAVSGRPMSVEISRGILFTQNLTLPADKIATVDDGAVYLTIDEEELEKWSKAPTVPYV